MTDNEILSHIDHTLLRPTATAAEIDNLCEEALRLKTAGGVKSRDDLEMFLNAGCYRIGTSSAVKLLTEK